MSTNSSFEIESRAVYKALSRMSKDFALQQASFSFWKDNFSNTSINPVEFATALQNHVGLEGKDKTTFMIALHAALTQSLDVLSPVPPSFLSESTSAITVSEKKDVAPEQFIAPNSPHWTIITEFMKHIVAEVKKTGQENFLEFQEILIEEQGELSQDQFLPITKWVESSFSQLNIEPSISESECAIYSHHTYLMLCEIVGPPTADKILDTTIRRLTDLPEHTSFDAKNLL